MVLLSCGLIVRELVMMCCVLCGWLRRLLRAITSVGKVLLRGWKRYGFLLLLLDRSECFLSRKSRMFTAFVNSCNQVENELVSGVFACCLLSCLNPEAIALTVSFCFSIICFISCSSKLCDSQV
jgi:hypothetical protein